MSRVLDLSSQLLPEPDLRREVVSQQLDDLNALAEALLAAWKEDQVAQADGVRATMARRALAMGWNLDASLEAIVAYAHERSDLDDDLFAPAFILSCAAPEREETAVLRRRLSPEARELLARLAPKEAG